MSTKEGILFLGILALVLLLSITFVQARGCNPALARLYDANTTTDPWLGICGGTSSDNLCISPDSSIECPGGPIAGRVSTWRCYDFANGPISQCTASRAYPVGGCGSGARNYDANVTKDPFDRNACWGQAWPNPDPVSAPQNGGMTTWKCMGYWLDEYVLGDCNATRNPIVGVCGDANRVFDANITKDPWLGTSHGCSGLSYPSQDPLSGPATGNSTTWTCVGVPTTYNKSCTASRKFPMGGCGSAARTYDANMIKDPVDTNYCTGESYPNLFTGSLNYGSTLSWKCMGLWIDNYKLSDCNAKRNDFNGTCGEASRLFDANTIKDPWPGESYLCSGLSTSTTTPSGPIAGGPNVSWTCQGSEVARNTLCSARRVALNTTCTSCTNDLQCPGAYCVMGQCLSTRIPHCPDDELCFANACAAEYVCATDADCPRDANCINTKCVPYVCKPACGSNELCTLGNCVPVPSCFKSNGIDCQCTETTCCKLINGVWDCAPITKNSITSLSATFVTDLNILFSCKYPTDANIYVPNPLGGVFVFTNKPCSAEGSFITIHEYGRTLSDVVQIDMNIPQLCSVCQKSAFIAVHPPTKSAIPDSSSIVVLLIGVVLLVFFAQSSSQ